MPRHKKGTLVRITEEALEPNYCDRTAIVAVIKSGGMLFIVEKFLPVNSRKNPYGSPLYMLRSVSTGWTAELFPNEITTRKPKEQKNNDT